MTATISLVMLVYVAFEVLVGICNVTVKLQDAPAVRLPPLMVRSDVSGGMLV